MRVVRGSDFGGSVQAIAPIFQVASQYKKSQIQGRQGDDIHVLLAPAGFAVGGLQVGAGAWTDAVRLVYMRLAGNKLLTEEREYSEWVGGDGGRTSEILGDGGLVIGVVGTIRENVQSLGLMYVSSEELTVKPVAQNEKPAHTAAEVRVWKSAGGKHSIKAMLKAVEDGKATLVTSDGRTISVLVEKLSEQDQEYLRMQKDSADKEAK
jgi:hypothetical protein